MRLGRKAVKRDSRTLRLSNYLTPALPPPPPSVDWSKGVKSWGVMCNDQLGCCTIAGAAHGVQVLSLNSGKEITISDAEIVDYYSKWDGYVPGDPSTDNGGINLDVLNDWKKQKFAGHELIAFAEANVGNLTEIKHAIALFGGLYIGMTVPNFIMAGTTPELWNVVANDGGIDGGHCVFCIGYDHVGVDFISWGNIYKMTWAFWTKYVDEASALLGADFLKSNGLDPAGFNLKQLESDLARIR